MKSDTSAGLFDKARAVFPGGVDSPVRARRGVGAPHPLFTARGRAAHTWDVDGNEYIDLASSWGPTIVGWCHPHVREALHAVVDEGTGFGAPTERGVRLAELPCEGPVRSFADAKAAHTARYAAHWRGMIAGGVHTVPSQSEAVMVSPALTDDDVAAGGGAA